MLKKNQQQFEKNQLVIGVFHADPTTVTGICLTVFWC